MKATIKSFAAIALLQLVIAEEAHDLSYAGEIEHFKESNAGATSEKSEKSKSSIPSGFENFNNNYDGKISLRDSYTTIGDANIFYDDAKDIVTLSKKAQNKIVQYYSDKLTKKGKIALANKIKHKMPATTKLAKFYEAQSADNITCHFDYNNLYLYILIPNKYYTNASIKYKHSLYHPDPTFYTPSLKSSIYTYYDHYSSYDKLKWETSGSISSGRTNLIYDLNNTVTNHVNDLYLEYHGSKYTYDIGYKEPSSTSVITPYGNIWGFFITENLELINNDFYSLYKEPLYLTVDKPYYTEIKYRGKVLYRGTLLQGENVIETNKFPLGTYNIDISKRDLITGEVTESTEVFSNQSSKYNWLHSGLEIAAGLESEYFDTAFTDKTLYMHAQKGYTLFNSDTDIFYTFANDTSYIGIEYNSISSSELNYSISASISQTADLYFSATSSYLNGKSKYSANIYSGFADDFSDTKSQSARLQYTYTEQDWRINTYATYDFEDNKNISATIYKDLNLKNVPTTSYLTLQYSNDTFSSILGLSISFDINKNTSSSTSLGYSSSDATYSISNTTSYDDHENDLKLTNTLYFSEDSYNLTSATYDTDMAEYAGEFDIEQSSGSTAISSARISINTNLYLTPNAYLFSSTSTDEAYVVKMPNLTDDDSLKFVVNDTTAQQGDTVIVPSSTFKHNTLSVVPSTMQYNLKRNQWNEFFYPHNLHTPTDLEIQKTCLASFYADIPKNYNYTFAGMEESFYGNGQQKTVAHMSDGIKLTYIYLNKDHEQCETGVVVNCDGKKKIDLGKLSCQHNKK